MQRRQHPRPNYPAAVFVALRQGFSALGVALSGLIAAAIAGQFYAAAATSEAAIGRFSMGDLSGWQEHSFAGRTQYTLAADGAGRALRATAIGSASVLCRETDIDLAATPIAEWRWRLDRAPIRGDERSRGGDDQGLRVSFLHRDGILPGSVIAIQYVWSQSEAEGAFWPNAFSPEAYQLAAESGPARPGDWVAEKRDLRADFRRIFNRDIDRVDGVCVMTDGDQTGALVEGWYGDISVTRP